MGHKGERVIFRPEKKTPEECLSTLVRSIGMTWFFIFTHSLYDFFIRDLGAGNAYHDEQW